MRVWKRYRVLAAAGEGGGGAGGAGGAAGDKGGGAAGAGGAGDKGADKGGEDATALKAQVAALQAKLDAQDAAAAKAKTDAENDAEAQRQSKLTAQQKVDEELAKQRADIDATKLELVNERRALALDKLGVVDKFKGYAPQVDPSDPKGAKELEAWAKANPELLVPAGRQAAAASPLDSLKGAASSALQQVIAGTRKSTLVTKANLAKLQ